MATALQLLNILLPLGYLLAALAYLVVFMESPEWARKWATPITAGVAGGHLVYLLLCTVSFRHVPVANAWEGFTFIAFAMVAVYLALEWRWKDKATGVFLLIVTPCCPTHCTSASVTATASSPAGKTRPPRSLIISTPS